MTDNKIVNMRAPRASTSTRATTRTSALQRYLLQLHLRHTPGRRLMVLQTVHHPVRSLVLALMTALLATAVFAAAAQTPEVAAPVLATTASVIEPLPVAAPVRPVESRPGMSAIDVAQTPDAALQTQGAQTQGAQTQTAQITVVQAVIAPAMSPPAAEPLAPLAPEPAPPRIEAVRVLVVAGQESSLSAPAPGRVASVGVQLGDTVRRGQVLVAFDCTETAARRDAARTDVSAARLQHEAKMKLQGLQSAAEVEVELAAVNVDRSEAQVRVFDAQLAQCQFSAPFAGRVARVFVKPGQSVAIGAPIVDLVGTQTLKFRMNVPSRWLATLNAGDTMEAEIEETGSRHTIKVARMSARVDAVSQTVEIEAELQGKADKLLPGMSGRAWLAAAP